MNINFKDFQRYIKDIQEVYKFQDALCAAERRFKGKNIKRPELRFPTLADDVIDLLERMTDDTKDHWISYWIYELNFGKNYNTGSVIDTDGTPIPLKTINDLYVVLNKFQNSNKT